MMGMGGVPDLTIYWPSSSPPQQALIAQLIRPVKWLD